MSPSGDTYPRVFLNVVRARALGLVQLQCKAMMADHEECGDTVGEGLVCVRCGAEYQVELGGFVEVETRG